ncbi:CHAD domain-containing protein [Klenkia marina]|uniref:CHAD domain-containing protein n=1 Tax=Klenkia marina TaxID=1960309 RepID=A0A1G4YYV7_9ACTN|nr:CYTH and CHAD domain-containing protein [Klenkia marina]SCX58636.1 CHAD domain-containing protein [Klenkia marina]
MATEHTEIERKFDVEETFVVPDLSGVPGVASVGEPVVHELSATYYDTADLRLARAKITLRRRTGGTDAGWHLKLPAEAGARRELHSPLGRAVKAPPRATLAPVLGVVRRAPTAQVATLATRRTLTTLLAEDGRVLAEVADDQVTGTALPATPGDAVVVTTWREVEVELVDGDEGLLSAVGAELEVSGARPSASAAKLARVLADRLAGPPPAAVQDEDDDEDDEDDAAEDAVAEGAAADGADDAAAGEQDGVVDDLSEQPVPEEPLPTGKKARAKEIARRAAAAKAAAKAAEKAAKKTAKKDAKRAAKAQEAAEHEAAEQARLAAVPKAGDVVVAALAGQLAALQRADLMVRTDVPDGVHQVRVAARRLRSILAAYRPVIDRTRTDAVRDELQWLGQELSGTRDAEVSVEHLRELVAAQPVEFVLGPVAARLQQAELQGGTQGAGHAVAAMSTPRYLTLLDTLHALVDQPPLTELAAEPAEEVLAAVLRRTVKRLQKLVDTAEDAEFAEDGPAGHALAEHGAAESPYELALHEVRKAGKRVRYTAEVAAPVLDGGGKKKNGAAMGVVDAMKQLQDVLGDRQDTVVTRELCRTLGLAAFAAGENAWTYGRLHALEEMRAMQAERDFWALWPTLGPVLNGVTRKR